MNTLTDAWHRPTRSGSSGQCVEARQHNGLVEVRNSNRPNAGTVRFDRPAWEQFMVALVERGEFRLP